MIKMIDKLTGTEMWVADNRVDEYLAAGNTLAAPPVKPKKVTVKKEPAKKGK